MEQELHTLHDPNSTLCRTCLKRLSEDVLDTTKHDIFLTPEVVKKLVLCTSLTVEPQDGYPKYLCDCCYTKVNEFHQFQKMCIESTQRFSEILLSREDATGDSVFEDEKNFCDSAIKLEVIMDETDMLLQSEDIPVLKKNGEIPKKNTNNKIISKSKRVKQSEETEQSEEEVNNEGEFFNAEDELPLSKLRKKVPAKCKSKISTTYGHANNFTCDQCPKYFMSERNLIGHKRRHEGLFAFQCSHEDCTKGYARYSHLIRHLAASHSTEIAEKQNSCICPHPGCGKVFKHAESLQAHARRYHKPGGHVFAQHYCEICGKVFSLPSLLRHHLITHRDSSEYPYACDQTNCDRRFSNKYKLKVHLMRHANIRNYVCPHCGIGKTTHNELRKHINNHTRERQWICPSCAHVSTSAGNMRRHIRVVHEGMQDHACRYCDRKFGQKDTLKYHEMTHTGEKPHECTECGKCFTQPVALKTHEKTHQRKQQ